MDWGVTEKPVKVKVVFTEPFIANPDDLQDDLPEYVNNFSDWYKAQLESNLGSQTKGALYSVEKISMDKVRYDAAPVRNGVNIKVPKVEKMDSEADIYLVMNDIWIGRVETQPVCTTGGFSAGGMGLGTTCSSGAKFSSMGNFAYYNAKTGKRLGYGVFEAGAGYSFAVTQSDWLYVVEETVFTMVQNTPIKK
jgi:hypothetical protein